MKTSFLVLIALLTPLTALPAATVQTNQTDRIETKEQRAVRMAWWREARFGMFLHYGPVSLTGKEISWSRANSNSNCPNNGPTPVAVYDSLYNSIQRISTPPPGRASPRRPA
jgi:hypothetical protein